jgi:acyl carrier protein
MQSLNDRVVAFVSKQLRVRTDRIALDTTIFGDLHTDGDDGVELLQVFGKQFGVDMSGCDPSRHFGPEGFVPWAPLCWVVLAFRKSSPEERARLEPISISDLVHAAERGRWAHG